MGLPWLPKLSRKARAAGSGERPLVKTAAVDTRDEVDCLAPPCRVDRELEWQEKFRRWEKVAHEPLEGAGLPRQIRQDWLDERVERRREA